MSENDEDAPRRMLIKVLNGAGFGQVAKAENIQRGSVEHAVKKLALALQQIVGVVDVDENAKPTLGMLHRHRDNYLEALEHYRPECARPRGNRSPLASGSQVMLAVANIQNKSTCPKRDKALILLLFATGARPDEIARLKVRDYLQHDGNVRERSQFRKEAAANGRVRPLYFVNHLANEAIEAYLNERIDSAASRNPEPVCSPLEFRGLDPDSMLFLGSDAQPLALQQRHGPNGIHWIYQQAFQNAGLQPMGTLAARRTFAHHLRRHGIDDRVIAEFLGFVRVQAVTNLLRSQALPLIDVLTRFP